MMTSWARRGRSHVSAILILCLFAIVFRNKSSVKVSALLARHLCAKFLQEQGLSLLRYHYTSPLTLKLPFAALLSQESQASPVSAIFKSQEHNTVHTKPHQRDPSFHVLAPASDANGRLCKNLLSSHILNYPPPTLINFGKVFEGEEWDKGSHTGKIQGVFDFLNQERNVHDDDLVLVIDGYDVWFQLPPEVLVRRYHAIIDEANRRLRREYGTVIQETPWKGNTKEIVQRYQQSVIFGADKLCWPNQPVDPACASLPESTLRKDIYGPQTDMDPEGFANRPKYLNSGTIIGPVSRVRAIYRRALEKVEEGRGTVGDQFVFAEIFGEQEQQRMATKASSRAASNKWLLHMSGTSWTNSLANYIPHPAPNVTRNSDSKYEFSIGLDYRSSIFQTMTHSLEDVEFIDFTNTKTLHNAQSRLQIPRPQPLTFPSDLTDARPPYPTNHTITDLAASTLLPTIPSLDTLPDGLDWQNLSLATNIHSRHVPTLLHINGDKSPLETWWSSMWFQPDARALLRRYMRTPQPFLWGTVGGEEKTWDKRGGRGGVWNTNGRWMAWGKLCKGFEEEVFVDGKGEWGKEEGDGRTFNYWGQQITGEIIEARSMMRGME